MSDTFKTISPIDGEVLIETAYAKAKEIENVLALSKKSAIDWQGRSIAERAEICLRALDYFNKNAADIATEITQQMGRPISASPGELKGLSERLQHMVALAPKALEDLGPSLGEDGQSASSGTTRFIRKQALGLVFVIAPWNYPFLTAVNAIVPALMAGNTVLLKHSAQTPLCARRFYQAFKSAGLPEGVFQYLDLRHEETLKLVEHDDVKFVSFTGSVQGGSLIEKSAAGHFKGIALELGGKDPAYVREDADLALSVENLVDGAFFNSGQSCCGVERIYVHESLYQSFSEKFVEQVKAYRLGNPLDPKTNLGPLVSVKSAAFVRQQIDEAAKKGARLCLEESDFEVGDIKGENYLLPQVLLNVDHNMSVMTQESFGPLVGIMSVKNDDEALSLMNDSEFGLTASLWTNDVRKAEALGNKVQAGTIFMNRCDYLDPALVWTGVKNSGRGYALSNLAYDQLTQAKSYHFKE